MSDTKQLIDEAAWLRTDAAIATNKLTAALGKISEATPEGNAEVSATIERLLALGEQLENALDSIHAELMELPS